MNIFGTAEGKEWEKEKKTRDKGDQDLFKLLMPLGKKYKINLKKKVPGTTI